MTTPPCVRRASHHHTLTYRSPSRPDIRRTISDRCNSFLFWSTAAWALLTGLEPAVDGERLMWPGARDYLETHAVTRTGGMARRALKMVNEATSR